MQVWNILHAARWKYMTQNSPSVHHRTTLSGYIFASKAVIDNWKKLVRQQHLFHTSSQYGELRPTSGWDGLAGLGHPNKFHRVSRLGFVIAPTSLNGSQPNCARCLAVSWAGRFVHSIYIFGGCCRLREFCQMQNDFTSKSGVLLYWQHYCTALEQWALAKLCGVQQRAPPIFDRAAIALGIGPHSSSCWMWRVERSASFVCVLGK